MTTRTQPRAVLVGCDYRGTRSQLNLCVKDAGLMYNKLRSEGYKHENILMLVDHDLTLNGDAKLCARRQPLNSKLKTGTLIKPTRENIMAALDWARTDKDYTGFTSLRRLQQSNRSFIAYIMAFFMYLISIFTSLFQTRTVNGTRSMNRAFNNDKDTIVFYYSGHGTYLREPGKGASVYDIPDEKFDEAIVPLDFRFSLNGQLNKASLINDDTLRIYFVDRLTSNKRLIAIFDCCYSGTMLDLPIYTGYVPYTEEELRSKLMAEMSPVNYSKITSLTSVPGYDIKKLDLAMESENIVDSSIYYVFEINSQYTSEGNNPGSKIPRTAPEAEVICFAGCVDYQTSSENQTYGGFLTNAILKSAFKTQDSLLNVLRKIHAEMVVTMRASQRPVLTSSRPILNDDILKLK